MRIAVLGSIAWPSPPAGYGPWEQIAFDIASGLRRRGIDATLFATGNSQFDGPLASVIPVGLNQDPALDGRVFGALHVGELFRRAGEFDLIHNNFDWMPLTYALGSRAPAMLTTVHGFSSPQILAAYYAAAWRSFYCSISDADRDPGLAYLATTYNGVDPAQFPFSATPGDYLLFLGRFHPEKGTHRAIAVAKRAGIPLKIAAIAQDEAYFRDEVAPHIDGARVIYLGAVDKFQRNELLAGALALVHLTTRPERFGMTLIEAMACGTPVLGARMGSIPEIVVDGVTGILCDDDQEAVDAVPRLSSLDRHACRRRVEAEFTVERMIDRYVAAYRIALEAGLPPPPSDAALAARAHDWWDRPMAFTEIPPKPQSLHFS